MVSTDLRLWLISEMTVARGRPGWPRKHLAGVPCKGTRVRCYLLEAILVLVRLLAANNWALEGLVLLGHHHGLQTLKQYFVGLGVSELALGEAELGELGLDSPVSRGGVEGAVGAKEMLAGIIDAEVVLAGAVVGNVETLAHVTGVAATHGHAGNLVVHIVHAHLAALRHLLLLLGGQGRRVDRGDGRVVLDAEAGGGRRRGLRRAQALGEASCVHVELGTLLLAEHLAGLRHLLAVIKLHADSIVHLHIGKRIKIVGHARVEGVHLQRIETNVLGHAHLAGHLELSVARSGRGRCSRARHLGHLGLSKALHAVISSRVGARLGVSLLVVLKEVVQVGQDLATACEIAHEVGLQLGEVGRGVEGWGGMGAEWRGSLHHDTAGQSG